MKTVFDVALLSAAVLAMSPLAHAQATCADITRINAASLNEFEELTGTVFDDDVYVGTLKPANASGCVIEHGFEVIYSCAWNFATKDAAERAYAAQAAALAPCLAGWKAVTLPAGSTRPGVALLSGVTYAGAGVHEYSEWNLTLEHYSGDAPIPYRLWAEMVLF